MASQQLPTIMLVLLLLNSQMVLPTVHAGKPYVGADSNGNIHINTTAGNGTVYVNGMDLLKIMHMTDVFSGASTTLDSTTTTPTSSTSTSTSTTTTTTTSVPPLMIKTLDSEGTVGLDTSLALVQNTNAPVISYRSSNLDLKIAICSDALCSSTSIKTLDSESSFGLLRASGSLALVPGTNAPVISYSYHSTDDLRIAVCSDAVCSSTTVKTLDSGSGLRVGDYTSLALVPGTNAPVISYLHSTNGDLRIAICPDALCSSTTRRTLDSRGHLGEYTSLALVPGTNAPVISYLYLSTDDLRIAVCSDAVCSRTTVKTLDSGGAGRVGEYTSLALVPGTNAPVISYYDRTNRALKIAICSDALCSGTNVKTLDSQDDVGEYTSLALVPGTNAPVISYYDRTNRALKIAICTTPTCD